MLLFRSAPLFLSASLLAACAAMQEQPPGPGKEMTVEAALQSVTDSVSAYKRSQDARKQPNHVDVEKVTVEMDLAYSQSLNKPVVVFHDTAGKHHRHGDGGHGNRVIITLKRHADAPNTPVADVRPPTPRPPLNPVPPAPAAHKPGAHRKATKQSAAEPAVPAASDSAPASQGFRLPPVTKPYDIIN